MIYKKRMPIVIELLVLWYYVMSVLRANKQAYGGGEKVQASDSNL